MNTFVLESEDLDFLMSEECQMFMYEAAPKVKESFIKRAIAKIKEMLQKILDFITSASIKKQAERIKKVVDANPQIGTKKVKIKDYQETYKLGKSALKKLEKAKTKEEADKIVAQYKRNRVIKTVTISVAALATLVAGGKLFQRARGQMMEMDKELSRLQTEYNKRRAEYFDAENGFKNAEARVKRRIQKEEKKNMKTVWDYDSPELERGSDTQRYKDMVSASEKLKRRHQYKLDQMSAEIYRDVLDKYVDVYTDYSLGIIRIMGKDVHDDLTKVFQTLKNSVSSTKVVKGAKDFKKSVTVSKTHKKINVYDL